jgi:hypothetical protein
VALWLFPLLPRCCNDTVVFYIALQNSFPQRRTRAWPLRDSHQPAIAAQRIPSLSSAGRQCALSLACMGQRGRLITCSTAVHEMVPRLPPDGLQASPATPCPTLMYETQNALSRLLLLLMLRERHAQDGLVEKLRHARQLRVLSNDSPHDRAA